jgi:hypothetical protein
MGEIRNEYKIWIEALKGERPFGRPRRRWEDNIRMYLREIWWEILDWMRLAQDREIWRPLMKTIMNLQVP